MTYFDKLLEKMGGDNRAATEAAVDYCPNDYFSGAPGLFVIPVCNVESSCGKCWFSEVEE